MIHPPVRTDFFTPGPVGLPEPAPGEANPRNIPSGFWLAVSALEPYKRLDLAIEAANRARHPLVIAGRGTQEAHLRSIAGPSVRFMGPRKR